MSQEVLYPEITLGAWEPGGAVKESSGIRFLLTFMCTAFSSRMKLLSRLRMP